MNGSVMLRGISRTTRVEILACNTMVSVVTIPQSRNPCARSHDSARRDWMYGAAALAYAAGLHAY